MSESFELLNGLATKARDTAIALPEVQSAQTHETWLGFSLMGQRFVASMDEVSELMRVPQTTRVPGVKSFVLGVGNVRGRLMTVIDLALVFGGASDRPRSQRRLIAIEDEENLLGFVVDESHGMQHFPNDAFSDTADDVPEMYSSFVDGSYLIAGVQWPVLRLNKLVVDPRLEKLAVTH